MKMKFANTKQMLNTFLNIGRAIYESQYANYTGGEATISATLDNGNKIIITVTTEPADTDEEEE